MYSLEGLKMHPRYQLANRPMGQLYSDYLRDCESAKATNCFWRHKTRGGNATQWRFSTCAALVYACKSSMGQFRLLTSFIILSRILYQPGFGQQSVSRSWHTELWHLHATKLRPARVPIAANGLCLRIQPGLI